jgi:hypothetical protein
MSESNFCDTEDTLKGDRACVQKFQRQHEVQEGSSETNLKEGLPKHMVVSDAHVQVPSIASNRSHLDVAMERMKNRA